MNSLQLTGEDPKDIPVSLFPIYQPSKKRNLIQKPPFNLIRLSLIFIRLALFVAKISSNFRLASRLSLSPAINRIPLIDYGNLSAVFRKVCVQAIAKPPVESHWKRWSQSLAAAVCHRLKNQFFLLSKSNTTLATSQIVFMILVCFLSQALFDFFFWTTTLWWMWRIFKFCFYQTTLLI